MYMNFDMVSIFMIYGNFDLKFEISYNFFFLVEYMKGCYNLMVIGFYNVVDNCIIMVWSEVLKGQVYINILNIRIFGVEVNVFVKYFCGLLVCLFYVYIYENIKKG